MTINYRFEDVEAHGARIRAQAASGDFRCGAVSMACQQFITALGRNSRWT
jgi:hypothetical protein